MNAIPFHRIQFLLPLALALVLISGCQLDEVEPPESADGDPNANWVCGEDWVDTRDGKTYATVNINGTCFLAENLDFEIEGDYVSNGSDGCFFGFRYYEFLAAKNAVPEGWSLPSQADLFSVFGDFENPSPNVSELIVGGSSGFEAVNIGYVFDDNCQIDETCCRYFWATGNDTGSPKTWVLDETGERFHNLSENELTDFGVSTAFLKLGVRCIKE